MKLGIIGSGGHSNAVSDIALNLGYNDLYYFDNFSKLKNKNIKGKFIGTLSKVSQFTNMKFVIAVGDNDLRENLYNKLKKKIQFSKLIHPYSYVSDSSKVGNGTVVMPNVTIGSNVIIRNFSIINSNSIVEHDSRIGKFTHVCPGVSIAGNVRIGNNVFLGIGSSVINNINIGKNVLIGAGTTILKNIRPNSTIFNKLNYEVKKK